jgi:hypothetical protein
MAVPLQVFGQLTSNFAQAASERQNAQYYREQAEYARESARRAEAIAEFDYTSKLSQQTSRYAAGGVELSGSAALTSAGTIKNMLDEIFAIRKKGDLESKLAMMRGTQSNERADMLGSFQYNAFQVGGTLVSNWAKSELFPDWMIPEAPTGYRSQYQPTSIPGVSLGDR